MQVNGRNHLSNRIVYYTTFGIAVSLITVGLLTNFFIRKISTSFHDLRDRIQSVITGKQVDVSFKTDQQDEFGQLSNEIGTMLATLDRMTTKIYRAELDQQSSKYDALVNQINSHFLYNTLSMINWQAIDSGEPQISIAVQELSKFYRTTLNHGKSATTLRSEIENIKAYITLQLMLDDRFQVSYDVDSDVMEATVINLMIQPIVENAIEHGFVERKVENEIAISAHHVKDNLVIQIVDNGIGMATVLPKHILENGEKGYGLRNVDQRIKFYFGHQYGLKIETRVGVGTSVTITLPYGVGKGFKDGYDT